MKLDEFVKSAHMSVEKFAAHCKTLAKPAKGKALPGAEPFSLDRTEIGWQELFTAYLNGDWTPKV